MEFSIDNGGKGQDFQTNFFFPVDKSKECEELCNTRGNFRSESSEFLVSALRSAFPL